MGSVSMCDMRFWYMNIWIKGVWTALNSVKTASCLDWMERVNIINSIADASSYMHREGSPPLSIKHIKQNILLNYANNSCIADFNCARILMNFFFWTDPAGTYRYLAPGDKTGAEPSVCLPSVLCPSVIDMARYPSVKKQDTWFSEEDRLLSASITRYGQ